MMICSIVTMQIVLAAFACVVLLFPAAQAVENDEADTAGFAVKLGFQQFPTEHTCEGADVSPEIEILGLNASALAIIVEDPDAPSGTFTHWTIWNIPPIDVIPRAIAKNATIADPFIARQGINDFGEIGYAGPCPPSGKPHRYFFRIFGLDDMLDLPGGASVADLQEAMQGHVLQRAEAVATFGR
jgi:Raf kinase inhibitor-like YbhB/YbcL family protein